ncbi:UNVERIFIED_CONTAM: hypothetical protein Slati_4506500 [Sesamum latifolium]|uniref:Uncharacterized protein n=1 Tax=Sesamum latifolium TaxID=2727402 RepID=A0AAW2SU95_9LAMI
MRDVNIPGPDPESKANILALALALDLAAGPAVLHPLFTEQLRQFIMETINSTLRNLKPTEHDRSPRWKEEGHQQVSV